MSEKKRTAVWLIWAAMVIILLPLAFAADPPRNYSVTMIIEVCVVFLISALFNFKVQGTDIITLQGIGLAAFLIFGLFVEILMTQFGILTYLLSQRVSKNDLHRIPLNSLMFLFVSISSAAAFYALGGNPDELAHSFLRQGIIPVIGYYVVAYVVNEIFLHVYRRWVLKTSDRIKLFKKDMVWEIVATLLMMPLGMAFSVMYFMYGVTGITVIAVPMVALSMIIRLINNSQELIRFLQRVNRLGQLLTEELSEDHVFNLFFKRVPEMITADYVYMVSYKQPENPKMVRLYKKENEGFFVPFQQEADISLKVYRQGKPVLGLKKNDIYPFLEALSGGNARSFLSVPMMYRGQVIGVLTAASHANKAYRKSTRVGMEIVGDFLAIALENARNYEKRKKESERCPLTDLFNYRYLMKALNRIFCDSSISVFSLIMIDIDNFKSVNDTYGHQNGNAILIGIADRLRKTVGDMGIIARYGGEELTVVLPGTGRSLCFEVAESIRLSIASEPFMVYLQNENRYKRINVTISLGTSTAPDDAKNPTELIYNADHAMYAGAKRKGKNRVARFV
ncbi:sensor domain-containing diguanylate cyclase [Sporolactobacillus sp. THM7-4]|nr:sensor domain-containing diguanylate cyclase [Sporolactobacillus sp. THM7-4]